MIKLNLGCGPIITKNWINVDYSLRARLKKNFWWLDDLMVTIGLLQPTEFTRDIVLMDLNKPLKFSNNSFDIIYMGEVLEHFERKKAVTLLS